MGFRRIFRALFAVLLTSLCFGAEIPLSIIVTPTRSEAERALAALHNGGDFDALARAVSVDPSASSGGYLGMMEPGNLRAELSAGLEGITAGNVSPIVKIPSGFAILKVLNAAPGNATAQTTVAKQAVSGAGSVRLTYDYAGFAAALRAVEKVAKPEGWDRDMASACKVRTDAIPAVIDQVKPLLQSPGAPPALKRDANLLLADLNSYLGEAEATIEELKAAMEVAKASSPERVPQLEEYLGLQYLQRAGRDSLYAKYVFPKNLPPSSNPDLKAASTHFLAYLERVPDDGEVRWLLNLTHMLAGDYPAGVPSKYRIAPDTFKSSEDIIHFTEIAAAAGVQRVGQAGGAIADDFDNDGLIDLAVSSVDDCEPLRLYRNNGNGTFTNVAEQAGLANQTGGLNILQADYNNDGCLDLLILRGGWEYGRRKTLLKSDCHGKFNDVTAAAGLLDTVTATQTAAWADVDNDGNLDLFVGNENAAAQLYLSRGDGTFQEIGTAAGIAKVGFTKGVVAGDYDNDGFPDLYISALNGAHYLYHNNRNRTFTEVTAEAGVEGPWTTFGAIFFDYDNDGWQDLLVAGYGVSVEDVMNGYLGKPQRGETLRLFRNQGGGKFRETTAEMGLKRVFMPMGLNFGDIDNDGYPDLYLGSGNPSYASPVPNVMYHNNGGKGFIDITASSGTGILPKGHGIAFADFDNDGDEDIYVVMGGAVPGDRQTARLFRNPGNSNNWIRLRLVGKRTNRSAIGARIDLTVKSAAGTRHIFRTVTSGGSFGSSPFEQHIGIGKGATIERATITWPGSTKAQVLTGLKPNTATVVDEQP